MVSPLIAINCMQSKTILWKQNLSGFSAVGSQSQPWGKKMFLKKMENFFQTKTTYLKTFVKQRPLVWKHSLKKETRLKTFFNDDNNDFHLFKTSATNAGLGSGACWVLGGSLQLSWSLNTIVVIIIMIITVVNITISIKYMSFQSETSSFHSHIILVGS